MFKNNQLLVFKKTQSRSFCSTLISSFLFSYFSFFFDKALQALPLDLRIYAERNDYVGPPEEILGKKY